MDIYKIANREQSHERYEANRAINTKIQHSLRKSIEAFIEAPTKVCSCCYNVPNIIGNNTLLGDKTVGDIYYGEYAYSGKSLDAPEAYVDGVKQYTTIREGGCAVLCAIQGIMHRNKGDIDIAKFTEILSKQGYYKPGKGTWHVLYDNLHARRAMNVLEIFEALSKGSIVTCLVEGEFGRGYLNIVGIINCDNSTNAIVDGPEGRQEIPLISLIKEVEVAWIFASGSEMPKISQNTNIHETDHAIYKLIDEAFIKSIEDYGYVHGSFFQSTCDIQEIPVYRDIYTDGKRYIDHYNDHEAFCGNSEDKGSCDIVMCVVQGLRHRGVEVDFHKFVGDLIKNGYTAVDEDRTQNAILDSLHLPRVRHIEELFEVLKAGDMVTCLLEHHVSSEQYAQICSKWNEYVNITGIDQDGNFIVDNPLYGRKKIHMSNVLEDIKTIWVWTK